MIKRYYRSPSDGELKTASKNDPKQWIHVESPTDSEIQQLYEQYDLVPGNIEDALDEDEMSRLEIEDDQTYIYVRVALREKDGEFETIPLLMVMLPDAFITVTNRHVSVLESYTSGQSPIVTTDQTRFVLKIMNRITQQYTQLINRTSRRIKSVRYRLRQHALNNKDFFDFVMIEDELNEFLSALQPNNAVLRRFLLSHRLPEEDEELVEDVLLSNEQSIEQCNANIKSIVGVRDAHSSISDSNLNRSMKVLTVATLAVAIPNMFFGLYGMNVDTPFHTSPYAFIGIITLTVVSTVVVYVVGKKKKIF